MLATPEIIANIAEQKIREAQKEGLFDNLPGEGQPLELEDSSHIPPELRMAYKILKNSGCLPEEIAIRKEIGAIADLLNNCKEEKERIAAMKKLKCLMERIPHGSARHMLLEQSDDYYQRMLAKLERHERLHRKNSA